MRIQSHHVADNIVSQHPPRVMIDPKDDVIERLLAGMDATNIEDTHPPAPPPAPRYRIEHKWLKADRYYMVAFLSFVCGVLVGLPAGVAIALRGLP